MWAPLAKNSGVDQVLGRFFNLVISNLGEVIGVDLMKLVRDIQMQRSM